MSVVPASITAWKSMRFNQLDLNLLVALDALLAERNITAAGVRLHLSQSAMSSALARLRDYFDDELLVQVGRKMAPTPLGDSLAGPVRKLLIDIQTTIAARPAFDPAASNRRFTLMMSDYVASVLMTSLARRAAQLAPAVGFELLNNNVAAPAEYIDRAEVDFLIMPQEFLSAEHPIEPLFVDDYVCIVCPNNPAVGSDITLDQYLEFGHVVLQFSRGHVPAIDEWFLTQHGHVRRIEVIAMNFNLLPQFIIGTRRIATVHRRMAEYYRQFIPLKMISPPLSIPPLTEAVQWHRSSDRDPGSLWLRKLLKETAEDVARRH
jgi:LysR family transcriptional regulator, nod-box dependent transcriptional activator